MERKVTLYRVVLPINNEPKIRAAEFKVGPRYYTYYGDDAIVPKQIQRVNAKGYDGPVYGRDQPWGLTEQDAAIRATAAACGHAVEAEGSARGWRAREERLRAFAKSLGVAM